MASNKTVLIIFPGNEGRRPVIEGLKNDVDKLVGLVSVDDQRSSWAKDHMDIIRYSKHVPDEEEIDSDHDSLELVSALHAVQNFISDKEPNFFGGVMCYDAFGLELASYLAEKLGSPCTPFQTIRAFGWKNEFRYRCDKAGIPAIKCITIHPGNSSSIEKLELDIKAIKFKFPAVLKPKKGCGSWHVKKIDSFHELASVYDSLETQLIKGSFPESIKREGFILEEYFYGWEVDLDGFAVNGEVGLCLISDNFPASEPYFLEQGGMYPSSFLNEQECNALYILLHDVMKEFPGYTGCFHFEAKIWSPRIHIAMGNPVDADRKNEVSVMPMEMNARIGGAECPVSFRAVTGIDLPSVAMRISLGQLLKDLLTPSEMQKISKLIGRDGIYVSEALIPEIIKDAKLICDKQFNYVCSNNLYSTTTGVLKTLAFDEPDLDTCSGKSFETTSVETTIETSDNDCICRGTNLIQYMLFTNVIGKEVVLNNGSVGCLGWLAVGGDTPGEAQKKLNQMMEFVTIETASLFPDSKSC